MRFERAERRARRSGLTPLIDVVFLLLIFFMLASQLGQKRVLALEVAEVSSADSVLDAASTIELSSAEELRVAEQRIPLDAPTHILRAALADLGGGPLVLVADAQATVQQITRALVGLERAGAHRVTLAGAR